MQELRELAPKLTPITYETLANATLLALDAMGVMPTRATTRLNVAQCAGESGLNTCYNYCISGIKAKPNNGRTCWQYFATTERFSAAQIAYAQKLGPGLVTVLEAPTATRKGKVRIAPKHPYCCFRAYESLQDAMQDHLETLRRTFPRAWAALLTGDVDAFAHGLKLDGYYTADEDDYEAMLKSRLREEMRKIDDSNIVWGDVQ